jgi:peptidoglycan/LPS O-acetylase OafA/YrhL
MSLEIIFYVLFAAGAAATANLYRKAKDGFWVAFWYMVMCIAISISALEGNSLWEAIKAAAEAGE